MMRMNPNSVNDPVVLRGKVHRIRQFDTRSLKFAHTAHMCGGPKQVGGTKKLVDLKTF